MRLVNPREVDCAWNVGQHFLFLIQLKCFFKLKEHLTETQFQEAVCELV